MIKIYVKANRFPVCRQAGICLYPNIYRYWNCFISNKLQNFKQMKPPSLKNLKYEVQKQKDMNIIKKSRVVL